MRLNDTANQAAHDSSAAGFTLMSAVSRSLAHYTGGDYLVSRRLMDFINIRKKKNAISRTSTGSASRA